MVVNIFMLCEQTKMFENLSISWLLPEQAAEDFQNGVSYFLLGLRISTKANTIYLLCLPEYIRPFQISLR